MTRHLAQIFLARLKRSALPHKEKAPLSVLIVDDEEQVRCYVDRVLRQAGYRTALAKDAVEAMSVAATDGPIDLLVTDLMMPQVNGDELARRLRFSQPDLPVLYLTGFSDHLFSERLVLWEGEAFLDKPCSPAGLIEAVSLLSRLVPVDRRTTISRAYSHEATQCVTKRRDRS